MNNHVCPCQVQAYASGLQGDQKQLCIVFVEILHQLQALLLGRSAGNGIKADVLFLHSLRYQLQHGSKLGKQQYLMPAFHSAFHQFRTGIQFRGLTPVIFKTQSRVAAYLAQLHQLGKNLYLVFLKFLTVLHANVLFHMQHLGIVQLLLIGIKFHIPVFFQLFGQVLQYILLHPAQNKGRCHPLQTFQRAGIFISDHRRLKVIPEHIITVQIPRNQEIENAPEFAEPVLNGRSRQGIACAALYHLHRLCRRSGMVLDILGFIYDLVKKRLAFIKFDIPFQKIIGRHKHIIVLILLQPLPPLLLGTGDKAAGKLRRVMPDLLAPVIHQGSRRHHQGSPLFPLLLCRQQYRQHLQRLPKPHVIRQDSAQAVCLQRPKPTIAAALVSPHGL